MDVTTVREEHAKSKDREKGEMLSGPVSTPQWILKRDLPIVRVIKKCIEEEGQVLRPISGLYRIDGTIAWVAIAHGLGDAVNSDTSNTAVTDSGMQLGYLSTRPEYSDYLYLGG